MRCMLIRLLTLASLAASVPAAPEALLVVVGDQHSAYERTAQLVARVDRLRAENPGVPLAVLINGDSLEYGNVVARRTAGAIDFAMFAVEAARSAASADAAPIGATTIGARLPAGDITRFAFDAGVRFDGPRFVAEVNGAWLKGMLRRANQGPATPFAERSGENLVVAAPVAIEDARRYRFVTTDWVARNAKSYLGANPPALMQHPELTLKAVVLAALRQ